MDLPGIIKEAILQAKIAIREIDGGKIYGGVLEIHLEKLTKITEHELFQIRKLDDEKLIIDCNHIIQEAKKAFDTLKRHEEAGLTEEQVARIRKLLETILGIEKLVQGQTQLILGRRSFLEKAAAAVPILSSARVKINQPRTISSQKNSPRINTQLPVYCIVDGGDLNSEFLRRVISGEEKLIEPSYIVVGSKFNRLSGSLTRYRTSPGTPPLVYFFDEFYGEEIFKPSSQVKGFGGRIYTVNRDPLPQSKYRLIILTSIDFVDPVYEDNKQKIVEITRKRNIEIYVYGFLRTGITYKNLFNQQWNFVNQIYTTTNLDKNEFRRVIQEWKK